MKQVVSDFCLCDFIYWFALGIEKSFELVAIGFAGFIAVVAQLEFVVQRADEILLLRRCWRRSVTIYLKPIGRIEGSKFGQQIIGVDNDPHFTFCIPSAVGNGADFFDAFW